MADGARGVRGRYRCGGLEALDRDMMGRMNGEYFLPLLAISAQGLSEGLAWTCPTATSTVEYCARNNWIVGSPATVTEKIEKIYQEVGGFGVLLVFGFDYKAQTRGLAQLRAAVEAGRAAALKHLDASPGRAA